MDDTELPNGFDGQLLNEIAVSLRVCVGTSRPSINDLLQFASGTVLPLDRTISDDVQLFIGDTLFATGILEEDPDIEDGRLRVRITAMGETPKRNS